MVMVSTTISMMQQIRDQDWERLADIVVGELEGAYLNTTDQRVVYLLTEELPPLVIDTRPAPDILIARVALCTLQNTGCHCPHDDAEDEETDGKDCVINCCLLSSAMSTSVVGPEDHETESKRDTSSSEDDVLRPCLSSGGPRWEIVFCWKMFGCHEDVKGRSNKSEDDETAAEVYTAKKHLHHSYSDFHFLRRC